MRPEDGRGDEVLVDASHRPVGVVRALLGHPVVLPGFLQGGELLQRGVELLQHGVDVLRDPQRMMVTKVDAGGLQGQVDGRDVADMLHHDRDSEPEVVVEADVRRVPFDLVLHILQQAGVVYQVFQEDGIKSEPAGIGNSVGGSLLLPVPPRTQVTLQDARSLLAQLLRNFNDLAQRRPLLRLGLRTEGVPVQALNVRGAGLLGLLLFSFLLLLLLNLLVQPLEHLPVLVGQLIGTNSLQLLAALKIQLPAHALVVDGLLDLLRQQL
mmetsp:Transcript_47458/g.141711  ORF Transcript_47458/g.141711 Transcript_47458/m.141711 type:complete len:267 (+) Transcript_47458:877-1677(+)